MLFMKIYMLHNIKLKWKLAKEDIYAFYESLKLAKEDIYTPLYNLKSLEIWFNDSDTPINNLNS